MKVYTQHNPLDGLSANQIVQLLEQGSGRTLSVNLKNKAIDTVSQHQQEVAYPTLRSTMRSMFQKSELKDFTDLSAQRFLGESMIF